ncbi:MAG TPA: GNAT family N-acetyltransferase [Candidatus Binataceae bacterium]|nr:GNAT family N-acetyltransferase [Candidatus Binataceae bacterium]
MRNGAVAEAQWPARTVTLSDGQLVALRLMGLADREKMITFARSLPKDDQLFLRTDITQPSNVDEWMRHIKEGATVTVLAEIGDKVVGYASVHTDQARWTRTIGEIRMQVGRPFRGLGLGRVLAAEIFRAGQERGLRKMAAMMTPDQAGARAAFEKLGFQIEALLQSWVVDQNGRPRDLIIMSQMLDSSMKNAAA